MQKVYKGEANLTDEQVDIIFKESIRVRLVELHKIYGSDWNKLRANERIAIHSLYFNNPSLARANTNFRKHIKNYIETNDTKHLELAYKEVRERSNPGNHVGIQNRRNIESGILASHESPTYTKPNESPDSVKLKRAIIGKTVVPLNNDTPVQGVNSKYFIWRTKMDNKVRKDHVLHEGKVFSKDSPPGGHMPGTVYNCRCSVEEVPDYIIVEEEITESKAFELYLRKGIKHPILFSYG